MKKSNISCAYPCINSKFIFPIILGIIIIAVIISSVVIYNVKKDVVSIKQESEELKIQLEEAQTQLNQKVAELEKQDKFNRNYNKGLMSFQSALFESYNAGYNYDWWSWYYDQGLFTEAVSHCEAAREQYASANYYHNRAISYFEESDKYSENKYKELINNYIKASDVAIDINWAMYEACEYFESASFYYSYGNWYAGDSELYKGNEKIAKHDSLVEEYNSYLSKIEILEENI